MVIHLKFSTPNITKEARLSYIYEMIRLILSACASTPLFSIFAINVKLDTEYFVRYVIFLREIITVFCFILHRQLYKVDRIW